MMQWGEAFKNTGKVLAKIAGVLTVLVVAFLVGTMIGYSLIGDGGNPFDVFNPTLWGHLLDFFV